MRRKTSVQALARQLTGDAERAGGRRASRSVVGGHDSPLRQTVVTLLTGSRLSEHDTPGAATLLVLGGRVRLNAGDESWEARSGDLIDIPPVRHSVHALEDAAILLTTVPQEYAALRSGRESAL